MSIQQSGYYPVFSAPNEAAVQSTGSTNARTLSDRFAERINVKDFGAVGDGIADDWLAIQRALAAAGGVTDAATLTMPATLGVSDPMAIQAFGKWIPKLFYFGNSSKTVFFPAGTYAISRPLITAGQGFSLLGHNARMSRIAVSKNAAQAAGLPTMFNAIEPLNEWIYRELVAVDGIAAVNMYGLWPDYAHEGCIQNIEVLLGELDANNYMGNRLFSSVNNVLSYLPFVEIAPPHPTVSATVGTNTITINKQALSMWVGMKIKPRGHNTVYTVASFTEGGGQTTVTTVEAITETFNNLMALRGKPAANGITINGGENILIDRCYAYGFYYGSGFVIRSGSPAPVLSNCHAGHNNVAYEVEICPAYLLKPSGDNNMTFVRAGFYALASLVIEDMKMEDLGGNFSFANGYTFSNGPKEIFQFATNGNRGRPSIFTIIGGSININVGALEDSVLYAEYNNTYDSSIQAIGLLNNDCDTIHKQRNLNNNNVLARRARSDWQSTQTCERYGGKTQRISNGLLDWYVYPDTKNLLFDLTNGRGGILADAGSGLQDGTTTIKSRVGTTVTFTKAGHGLKVGDLVFVYSYISTTPSNTTFSYTDNSNDNIYTKAVYVKSVNGNDFTCTVADSGPTAGEVKLVYGKWFEFHGLIENRHIIQMPTELGAQFQNREAFILKDIKRTNLAGLRVATANEGDWWASKSLNMGGTIDSPASRILHGADAPAMTAPDGSIYLRTNGTADTTIYVRAGGSWTAIVST